jgi:hypothetical protein
MIDFGLLLTILARIRVQLRLARCRDFWFLPGLGVVMRRMVYSSQYIFGRRAPRLCTLLHTGRITLEILRSAHRIHWLLSFSTHFFALDFLSRYYAPTSTYRCYSGFGHLRAWGSGSIHLMHNLFDISSFLFSSGILNWLKVLFILPNCIGVRP